ncbi:MAG TPA: hypothetical protein VK252_05330 [Solirubrobacteraceae bacterium]|nr:hypothetical protein [Solirubrobacteraceae bacterium]
MTYDLDDPIDRARVYEQVLREGTEDDVRFYIDPTSSPKSSMSWFYRRACDKHGPAGWTVTATSDVLSPLMLEPSSTSARTRDCSPSSPGAPLRS